MPDIIKMNIQRWDYQLGNYQIIVENAWTMNRFAQERITVNGVATHDQVPSYFILLYWKTIFEDTVLTRDGELDLQVQWKSGLKTIKARLLIDKEVQPWTKHFSLQWIGKKGEWPDEDHYDKYS